MRMNHLLGAAIACALMSGAPLMALEAGWITEVQNLSNYLVTVQNGDDGNGNKIKNNSSCGVSDSEHSNKSGFFQVGCLKFSLGKDESVKCNHFVVPYQSHGANIEIQVIKPQASPIIYRFQEQNSKVVVTKDDVVIARMQRDGQCFYKLKFTNDASNPMQILDLGHGDPGWALANYSN